MKLILVSGLSGSGKSVALNVLEDAGYYCIDNLPATLVSDAAADLRERTDRVAMSVDGRSAAVASLPESIAGLRAQGIDVRVLFLEATDATLLRRYSETRRRHPLAGARCTLAEAIAQERELLAGVAPLGQRIDTTDLLPKALAAWIRDLLGAERAGMMLTFESFGFKAGIPLDADWVVDARMLPNPHYDPALRPLTGRDAAVIDFLDAQSAVQRLYEDIAGFLERWLPDIERDQRSHVTLAIGCTGGRHRSVYLAEKLAHRFAGGRTVLLRHRGLAARES